MSDFEEAFNSFVDSKINSIDINTILAGLHERLGLNVNVLLYCCWIAKSGCQQLRKKDIRYLLDTILPWQRLLLEIRKLRELIIKFAHLKQWEESIDSLLVEREKHVSLIEKEILDNTLLSFSKKDINSQEAFNACKNITMYCQELAISLDHYDAIAIKDLLSFIFPDADIHKIVDYWRAFENKRDRALAHLQQLSLF